MGNFRRKKILETVKNPLLANDEKSRVLETYDDYIRGYYGDQTHSSAVDDKSLIIGKSVNKSTYFNVKDGLKMNI